MIAEVRLLESPIAMKKFLDMDEPTARLAQSAERKALKLVVVGSSPTVGDLLVKARTQGALATKRSEFVSQ